MFEALMYFVLGRDNKKLSYKNYKQKIFEEGKALTLHSNASYFLASSQTEMSSQKNFTANKRHATVPLAIFFMKNERFYANFRVTNGEISSLPPILCPSLHFSTTSFGYLRMNPILSYECQSHPTPFLLCPCMFQIKETFSNYFADKNLGRKHFANVFRHFNCIESYLCDLGKMRTKQVLMKIIYPIYLYHVA